MKASYQIFITIIYNPIYHLTVFLLRYSYNDNDNDNDGYLNIKLCEND